MNTISSNATILETKKLNSESLIETRALDGKLNMREYLTSAYTTGQTTQRVSVLIRYSEYVDATGRYVSAIHNVYVYGGDYSAASFTMTNGYPTYSGIGTSSATIDCYGKLNYVSENIPYSHRVSFKVTLPAGAGNIIK
jgi:hypothetical protein